MFRSIAELLDVVPGHDILRFLAQGGMGQVYAAEESESSAEPGTWPEALRAIRRAQDRDRVGELAIAALTTFSSRLRVAALLVVRGHVAIGWLGRHRRGPLDVRALALPLDQPSSVAEAIERGEVIARPARRLGELDRRLAMALAADAIEAELGIGAGVVISPISLSEGRVACVLYCQLDLGDSHLDREIDPDLDDPDPAAEEEAPVTELVEHVVASMRSAFLRLIRAASR